MTAPPPALRRGIRLGHGLVFLLAAGVAWLGVLSWQHHVGRAPAAAAEEVAVTVTDRACEPAALTMPAGRTAFRIHNRSARVLEWGS